eukprot:jgi/Botrbrau1/18628/Bobra.0367s0065.1
MIIHKGQFAHLYEVIKADFPSSEEKKLIVFVSAADCDSVCALRILSTFLNKDNVYFSMFPVTTYAEIQKICETQLASTQDLKNVLFINCGATEDLEELFEVSQMTRIVVIDSHRPIHPKFKQRDETWQNIVLLLDDSQYDIDDIPDAPEEDEESSSEAEEDSDDEERAAQRQRLDEAGGRIARRRSRQERREARQKYRAYIERGASWGKPAACVMLEFAELAMDVSTPDTHMLWLAIVGLTDHFIQQHIALDEYAVYRLGLQTKVNETNAEGDDDEGLVTLSDGDGEVVNTNARKLHFGKIRSAEDFRFGLARHWTLYDAMLHSAFVAVRMETWHEKGRNQLKELIAKMGFRLKECQQDSGTSSGRVILRELPKKLLEHAGAYSLADVTFQSWQLTWESSIVMASDVVYAITALLEGPPRQPNQQDSCADRIWRAYNALAMRDSGELKHGLDMAKKLQRAVLSDGGLALVRKAVRGTAAFRLLDMRRIDAGYKVLMTQPLALRKLGMFVRDVYIRRDPSKRMGMVIVGTSNSEGNCLVVGITPPPGSGAIQGNKFGDLFREVAEKVHAEYRHDSFDSSVIEVSANDLDNFLRDLQHAVTG